MKCRRAFDADLAAVLRGDAGDADFVAHYPACPDCAAEVQVWRELDGMLRAGAPADAAHPDPEVLLAFADAPSALAAAVRSNVEQHLGACRVCADELRTLARFDPATIVAAGALAAAAAPAPRTAVAAASTPDVTDDAPSSGGWLGRMVWHPAFAYALVAVLLVPLLRDQLWRIPVASRVVDVRHEERRQAPESLPPVLSAAPAPAPAAPPPPPAGSADEAGTLANLRDQEDGLEALALPREADGLAQGSTGSKARVAADDAGLRQDAAPAKPLAPAQPAPAAIAEIARDERARPLDGPAAPTDVAPLGREGQARQPEVGAPAEPQAGFAARARGALAPGAGPQPEAEFAAKLSSKPAANTAAGGASGSIVDVRSRAPTLIPFAVAEAGVLLRLAPPADFAAGALDIQVRGRVGGHAITTRVTDRADAIAVRIPPRWLAPGDYVVTLSPVDALPNGAARPAAILGFIVSAPNAAAAGR